MNLYENYSDDGVNGDNNDEFNTDDDNFDNDDRSSWCLITALCSDDDFDDDNVDNDHDDDEVSALCESASHVMVKVMMMTLMMTVMMMIMPTASAASGLCEGASLWWQW